LSGPGKAVIKIGVPVLKHFLQRSSHYVAGKPHKKPFIEKQKILKEPITFFWNLKL
jgi:hypothetical protein